MLFWCDEQPYAMDTVVVGGNPNAVIRGLVIQELDSNHNVILNGKVGIIFILQITSIYTLGLMLICLYTY